MALFVYVTDDCKAEARLHSLLDGLENFQEKVEQTQSTSLFDPFPPPYFVKKKLGGRQGRLVAKLETIGEHAVMIFLSVLMRGQNAYEKEFQHDPVAYGEKHFKDAFTQEALAQFIEARTQSSPPPEKPSVTDTEYAFLYNAFSHHQDASDDMVYETREWMEQVTQKPISNQLNLIRKACTDALDRGNGLDYLALESKTGWGIWFHRSPGKLLLISVATDKTASTAEKIAQAIGDKLESGALDKILRTSRRAYPDIMLADEDIWIELEGETVANMALSPEESEVLESARNSQDPFPLFINGRAGSGKSTILQYLFTDLLYYYLTTPDAQSMAPPIYLTASGELLRHAQKFVEKLLRSEATFLQQGDGNLVEDNREILDGAFSEFHAYLLRLVSADVRQKRFPAAQRVDYARFRRLWLDRFGKDKNAPRDYGPDLSWHVIRSYIKGMSSETLLEPEDYAQLSDKQLTVTREAYQRVYNRVWKDWYQELTEEQGYWDDQDLTRYVLEHELAQPVFPAVFCDEAQDFTRLELELLLRINLFSNRSFLTPQNISRVPFVFAGDQFQTLNPTGFRWEAIKASFVEKFIYELDPASRSRKADLNYRELKYNYRSTHTIVRFSNHVQALRAALFQLPDLKPQIPWTLTQNAPQVSWFRHTDATFWNKYADNTGFVLIVPCAEGEELDYVERDPVLKQHIPIEDGIPQNVLSAARAKGCEYPAVIVYGFGDSDDVKKNLLAEFAGPKDAAGVDRDETLPLKYFINRLYVAVSRPKRRLVVVDTDKGLSNLWQFAQDSSATASMLARIKRGKEHWGEEIVGMVPGKAEDLNLEQTEDPLENAKAHEEAGIARRDPYLLKMAESAYKSAGKVPKALECRARALEAEDKLFEAGKAFFEAGHDPEGVACLWKAGEKGWKELSELVSSRAHLLKEMEVKWAIALTQKRTPEQVRELLTELVARLDRDKHFQAANSGNVIWQAALSSLLEPHVRVSAALPEHSLALSLAALLDQLREKGIRPPAEASALLCFAAQRYQDAILYWEEAGQTRSRQYCEAKAATALYPEKVTWLEKLGSRGPEIVQAYVDNPGVDLSVEQSQIICSALRGAYRWEEAMDLAWKIRRYVPMLDVALHAFRKKNQLAASAALHAALQLLALEGAWDMLGDFVADKGFMPGKDWKDEQVRKWIKGEMGELRVSLVRALARSPRLPEASSNYKQMMARFLSQYLRVREKSWQAHIPLDEAGCAFERTQRFTDTLQFYEAVLKDKSLPVEPQWIKLRWLITKHQQIAHEQQIGSEKAEKKAQELQRELDGKMATWQLKELDGIPTYHPLSELKNPSERMKASSKPPFIPQVTNQKPEPKIPAVSRTITLPVAPPSGHQESAPAPTVTVSPQATPVPEPSDSAPEQNLPDEVIFKAGPFELKVYRRLNRCNIEHLETKDNASFKLAEKKCSGDVDFTRADDYRWESSAWKMTVDFPRQPGQELTVRVQDLGIKLGIDV